MALLLQVAFCILTCFLQPAPHNLKVPLQYDVNGLRISSVLLFKDAPGQRPFIVAIEHGHSLLHDDRSMIKFLIDEMHRAAGDFHSVSESLLLRFEPRKSRQQRGMDVENPPRKLLHEPWREQPHVPRQADQVHFVLLQSSDNFTIVFFARLTLRWNDQRLQSTLACSCDTRCIGVVRNYNGNARIRNAARVDAVCDSHKVRAASGEENTKGM